MEQLRILALHGCGTSAAIWQAQSRWTFDFVDGDVDCSPPHDIASVYPGPFFCHYNVPTYDQVQSAHVWAHTILREDGPFDAVMGFSQGAALAASLILHHQDEHPFSPPLFRFAVFVNGSLPFSKSARLGVDFSQIWSETAKDEAGKPYTPVDDDSCTHMPKTLPGNDIMRTLPICRFSPRTHTDKIAIPTAHLYGKNDPWRMQSLRLMDLCEAELATCFEHVGAHHVPRTVEQSRKMADAILRTSTRAEFILR